jgi:hypothetical protein
VPLVEVTDVKPSVLATVPVFKIRASPAALIIISVVPPGAGPIDNVPKFEPAIAVPLEVRR